MRPAPGSYSGHALMSTKYNQVFRKAIISAHRTPPQSGDARQFIGMDPAGNQIAGIDELMFALEEYNGENWEKRFKAALRSGNGVADLFLSGFFQVGEGVLSSLGRIWKQGTNSFGGIVVGLAYGNEYVVGVTSAAEIERSSDGGVTFGSDISNSHTTGIQDVASNGAAIFMPVGDDGQISKSTDSGASFGSLISNAFATAVDDCYGIAYDEDTDTWVVVGQATTCALWSDDDGATWNAPTTAPNVDLRSVVSCGNGVFVANELSDGSVWRTTDSGKTWTEVVVRATSTGGKALAFGGGVVIVSFYESTYYAYYSVDDGLTWTAATIDGTPNMIAADYVEPLNMFVCGWHVSFDGGRSYVKTAPYGDSDYNFPFTPYATVYDPVHMILCIGGLSGETAYSRYLEAGAGIVEQGSNANGEYIVFSNGLQICWTATKVLSGLTAAGAYDNWTLPSAMRDTTYLYGCFGSNGSYASNIVPWPASSKTTTACRFRTNTNVSTLALALFAIGWAG